MNKKEEHPPVNVVTEAEDNKSNLDVEKAPTPRNKNVKPKSKTTHSRKSAANTQQNKIVKEDFSSITQKPIVNSIIALSAETTQRLTQNNLEYVEIILKNLLKLTEQYSNLLQQTFLNDAVHDNQRRSIKAREILTDTAK